MADWTLEAEKMLPQKPAQAGEPAQTGSADWLDTATEMLEKQRVEGAALAAPAGPKTETSATSAYLRGTLSGVWGVGDVIAGGFDRLAAGARSALKPGAGTYDEELAKVQGFAEADRAAHPAAATAGQITGGVASTLPLAVGAPALFGANAASGLARAGISGAANATLAGTDTLIRGGTGTDAAISAVIAGTIGAVLKPGMPAPTTAVLEAGRGALKAEKNAAYKASEQAGILIKPQAFHNLTKRLGKELADEGLDQGSAPASVAAMRRIFETSAAAQAVVPVYPTLKHLDILRQVASNAVKQSKTHPTESHMAGTIIRRIDEFLERAPNSSFIAPGNTNPKAAIESLVHARAVVTRANKSDTINEIIENAALHGSGTSYSDAIKSGFRSLATKKGGLRGFKPDEKEAIRRIASSKTPTGIARGLGNLGRLTTWRGSAGTSGAGVLGLAAGGLPGALVGTVGVPVVTAGLRAVGNRNINAAARRLQGGIQRGNLAVQPLSGAGTLGTAVGSAAALTAARPPPKRRRKRSS